MKLSAKLPRARIVFIATVFFVGLCLAPNVFVSSSHRESVETGKPAAKAAQTKLDFGSTEYSRFLPEITAGLVETHAFRSAVPALLAGSPNCDALVPSGGDDAIPILQCLNERGYVTLTQNTFLIYQPIAAVGFTNGVRITGTGKNTKIYPQFTCGDPRFLDGNTYRIPIEIRRSPNSVLTNFNLHLDQLRKTCGHGGNIAIILNKSENSRITGVKVVGSRYGDPGYTTGWVHGGGIQAVNSANTVITDSTVKDVGYAGGGVSVGFQGIGIYNSANSLVQNNTVTRVGFGIEIVNGSPQFGYTGDVSGSVVTGNTITGAALIGCPECSHGRAVKFQACSQGDELPIRNVTLTNNYATEFGGQSGGANANHGGSGLHLTCGVQYSTIENNTFIGAPTAEMGLLVDSMFPAGTPPHPTHHNTIRFNTFFSGRGQPGCNRDCADVEFNNLGPDQIGIDRGSRGTNTLKTLSSNSCGPDQSPGSNGCAIRVRFTHDCAQYGHAWFLYPSGQSFVNQGQSITVAGAGILPPSFFSVIRFSFRNASGLEVASYQTLRSQGNCVVNQEPAPINAAQFPAGLYTVYANYYDGNTDELYIPNDPIGTLDVRSTQANQPPVANAGGPYSGTPGTPLQFNGSGSFDPDGFITSYQWNFGDGTFGSGVTPVHAYAAANTYTVTLTVTDNGGVQRSASTTAAIGAVNQPPVASHGGPYSGTVGVAVQFNGSGSFDPDGAITNYQWNFGDGSTGSGATPTHVYASANTYNVSLTVTDTGGATGNASTTATISASQSQTPFNGPHNIPGTTQAEDFDNGGEGVAYHDLTAGNDFGQYRSSGVDIANSSGLFNDFDVANAWAGEWLEYTVQITGGTYDLKASVASDGPGGTFHYEIDGVSKGSITVPNTGGWGSFQLVTLPNVALPAGQHVLRVSLDTNGGQPFPAIANLNYFQFVTSGGSSGPAGYWKLDEGAGTLAADSSGNNNHGTLTNGPTWTAGRVNNSVNFDGANDYVQVGVRSSLTMANALTMSAWIKPAANTAGAHTILNNEGQYEMAYYEGQIAWAIANSNPAWNWVFTNYFPPVGAWTHIAVTYDGSSIRTYANGVQVHSQFGSGSIVDAHPTENDFRIGSRQCSVCVEYFPGGIDEVRVYNRALSAAEILALIPPAGPASPLVGYWKFDESSGTVAVDSSGNGLNGALVNGPIWMGGRVNNSLYLDGFNDYVQVGSSPALKMTNTMTAAAWIYPGSGSSTRTIVNREGEYNLGELDGVVSWAFSNANPGWNWVSTGYSPPLFQWTHIAVTYANGVVKTYANGVLVHTYNGSGAIGDSSAPENDFRIGSRQCGFCSEFFQGGIDEVRLYDTALTAAEIQALANP